MLTNCLAACAHLTITVSEIERDICEKIVILSYPLHLTPPLGGFPSEYRHPLWYGKTRMVWLLDGEKISKICLFVIIIIIQHLYSAIMSYADTEALDVIHECDGRTDRRTLHDNKDRACIASCGKKWFTTEVYLKGQTNFYGMVPFSVTLNE